MAHLNKNSIQSLTELCRIKCTPDEESSLLADLESILSYVDTLQEIDTNNVPPCNHVLEGMSNVMREDIVGKTMPRELFLSNAPSHCNGLIRVPPAITKASKNDTEEAQ